MRFLLAFILLLALFSCRLSPVEQSFSSTDSLVIHFKNEQAGIITKTVQTADAKAIRRMTEFIDGKKSELFRCGYDGKMFFYCKGQQIQEVDFKNKDKACNHFSFLLHGKLVSTKMNNEAVDFLFAIENGMSYY